VDKDLYNEWLDDPCTVEFIETLQSKKIGLITDLVHKIKDFNLFLEERGRIFQIEEILGELNKQ
jgi:hypothetical protein